MSRLTPISLSAIRSHSIFRFPESSTSAEDDWELIDRFVEPIAQPKTSRMVMRDKELLIASGKELRMMTMSGGEGWEVSGDGVGRYKVGFSRPGSS